MNLYKKFFFNFIFNLSLFTFLIIGIQNSNQKSNVYLFKNKTIELPISFIMGLSFIAGSFLSSFIQINKSIND